MKMRIFFAWYDGWIGYYWDRSHRRLYLTLIPTLILQIDGKGPRRIRQRIACALGDHPYRLLDPARNAWDYNVWICDRGCPGYWARERHDMNIYFFRIAPRNWAQDVHQLTSKT